MKKRIAIVTVVLTGLLLVGLPGVALTQVGTQTPGQGQYRYQAPAQAPGELSSLFLQALAEKLGISVGQLQQVIQAVRDEMGPQTQAPGQGQYQYQAPARAQVRGELSGPFLKALADRLGISAKQLQQAIQAVKEEMGPQTQAPGQGQYQYRAPVRAQVQGELPSLLLKVLADKLGISVDRLKNAIQAAKDEVIKVRLSQAVRAGRLTPERARALAQRLSQAEPRELLQLMKERSKARGQLERLGQRRFLFGEELKRGRLIGPRWPQPQPSYMPPYYPPYYRPYLYPYSCVCYCNIPGFYFAPTPRQPQPMMPQPWKFYQPYPQFQPQSPGSQTPQNP